MDSSAPRSFRPNQSAAFVTSLEHARCSSVNVPEIQGVEKLLDDTGGKLSSVTTDLSGVSSRAMLQAQRRH
jgi:hypothetical protein